MFSSGSSQQHALPDIIEQLVAAGAGLLKYTESQTVEAHYVNIKKPVPGMSAHQAALSLHGELLGHEHDMAHLRIADRGIDQPPVDVFCFSGA